MFKKNLLRLKDTISSALSGALAGAANLMREEDAVEKALEEGENSFTQKPSNESSVKSSANISAKLPAESSARSSAKAGAEQTELPAVENLASYEKKQPPLTEEVIEGILRHGHKMLISGPSKAGKTFLLMELAIAASEGKKWLGFQCKKSTVLYVNLEVDKASTISRFFEIYKALGTPKDHLGDIWVWNLRGYSAALETILPQLISLTKTLGADMVILDPIYKLLGGLEENSATDMSAFCNLLDTLCTETNASVAVCHHHSKGSQGSKRSADRASGSGVFARDPDAILDIIQIDIPSRLITLEDGTQVPLTDTLPEGTTAWQLSSTLREFPDIEPMNLLFEYPIHVIDSDNSLHGCAPKGSAEARKTATKEEHRVKLDQAYQACSVTGQPTIASMAQYCHVSERSIRDWIKDVPEEYSFKNGVVFCRNEPEDFEFYGEEAEDVDDSSYEEVEYDDIFSFTDEVPDSDYDDNYYDEMPMDYYSESEDRFIATLDDTTAEPNQPICIYPHSRVIRPANDSDDE